jgi:integrase
MATLFKRQNGIYYLKFRLPNGKEVRQSLQTKIKREALKIQSEVESRTGGKQFDVLSFAEAWTAYEAGVYGHKKTRTIYNEHSSWNLFTAAMQARGVEALQAVRVADVASWQAELLKAGRSPVGINSLFRACKIVWNHLLRLEVINLANPITRVGNLKEAHDTKYIEWDILQYFLDAAQEISNDIYLVFVLGALGGLRKEEILRARWEHVDWQEGRLFVDGTKSTASRDYIPLHDALRDALASHRRDIGYIVRPENQPTAAPHSHRWNFAKQWSRVEAIAAESMEADGIEAITHVTPHQLRHSVATHLLDIGYTLQQVAVFLRHANDIPTRRYASLKGVSLTIDKF